MADARPDGPRYLRDPDTPVTDTTAAVDVSELLARLAERTEELAEATVRQKHAEADLRRRTREVTAERKAHNETRQRLENDCQALGTECDLLSAERRGLEAEVARERNARTTVEADLKRVQDRIGSLQHKLKGAWGELRQRETEVAEQPSWWKRLGS
jgi:chromosome segregation ATPase